MVFAALIVIIYTVYKKEYRNLFILCLSFLYGLSNFIISFAGIDDLTLYSVLKYLNTLLLIALLLVTVCRFAQNYEDRKKRMVSMLLCAGLAADRIVKKILFVLNSWSLILTDSNIGASNWLLTATLVLDIIHLILGVRLVTSLMNRDNQTKTKTLS